MPSQLKKHGLEKRLVAIAQSGAALVDEARLKEIVQ